MGNHNTSGLASKEKVVYDLKRLPRCLHTAAHRCRCDGNGNLPRPDNPAPARSPEFTMQELIDQTSAPVVTIRIDKPLYRSKLRGVFRKLVRKAKKEATEFVQGTKPILSQQNSLACIALCYLVDEDRNEWKTVKICFELKSFYIKGALVGANFYELRKSTNNSQLVQGSIPPECNETYLDMFGRENPEVDLSYQALVAAFWHLTSLVPDVGQSARQEAARCIGLLALLFMEPARQDDVAEKLCAGEQTATDYFTVNFETWEIIRLWDDRSKMVKGIDYSKDKDNRREDTPSKRSVRSSEATEYH